MKILLKFSLILLTIICFASCTKEYTCVCTIGGELPSSTTIEAKSKSAAKKECDEGDLVVFGVAFECEIE